MKTRTTTKTIKAIEALPAGTHKIAPRLYLKREERPDGTTRRSVIVRWMQDGRAEVKSLGSWERERYGYFLAEGLRAAEALRQGRDVRVTLEEGTPPDTFRESAESFMAANLPALTSAKHRRQWRLSVEAFYPTLGHFKITQLEVGHIAKVLEPHWLRIPTKARTVRRRIEQIISFAISRGNLAIANVAALELVRHRLPKQPRRVIRHRRALPYSEVAACFARLGEDWRPSSEALRFVMLTASRSSEVRMMRWEEVDLDEAVWTCPAPRMKNGKQNRVPLSAPALKLLARMAELRRGGPYVFPGQKHGHPLSQNVMQNSMRASGFDGDQHGMRSSFKDWCRESGIQREHGWESVEACLAHDVQGAVERHYGRSDLLHLRKPIMEKWGRFVAGTAKTSVAKPVTLKAA